MAKHFTVESANLALQEIRPLVAEILALRSRILARHPEVWPVMAKVAGNGGGLVANEVELEFQRLDELIHQVNVSGAVLKDLNIGLVDFPALRSGREVYLCWRYGEPEILFWHELEAGAAGRQPL